MMFPEKSIQRWRGLTDDDRNHDEEPYSASSYGAQYGITVELADDLIADSNNKHGNVLRMIGAHFKQFPEARKMAIQGLEQKPKSKRSRAEEPTEVEGFATPQKILGANSVSRPSKKLVKVYGDETTDQLIAAALTDDAFQEWLEACIQRGDHNLQGDSFHLEDVAEPDREPVMRMLAMKYLENLLGDGG